MLTNINTPQVEIMHLNDKESAPDFFTIDFDALPMFLSDQNLEEFSSWAPVLPASFPFRDADSFAVTAFIMLLPQNVHPSDLERHIDDFAHIVYASHTDADEAFVTTIVIPLARPVPMEHWPKAFEHLNNWFGGLGEQKTKNPYGLYRMAAYLPEIKGFDIEFHDGMTLDLNPDLFGERDSGDNPVPVLRNLH